MELLKMHRGSQVQFLHHSGEQKNNYGENEALSGDCCRLQVIVFSI
jgi:hypothetical protein